MPITDQESWNKCVKNNKDPYGAACIKVAKRVMEILDEEREFSPYEIINRADTEVKAGGITGFMAGCVAQMVSYCHSRGEEFRKAWNGAVGKTTGQEDTDGVLNPAILNISL